MIRTINKGHVEHKNYFEESNERLNSDIRMLDQSMMDNDVDYCIIGGVAVREYGFNRNTADIDILVDKRDESKLSKVFGVHDKSKFEIDGVKVDVLFSGERVNKNGINYPKPADVKTEGSKGGKFINLKTLILMKIDTFVSIHRYKDLGDVQELIRANKLPLDYFDDIEILEYKNKYKEIWDHTFGGLE